MTSYRPTCNFLTCFNHSTGFVTKKIIQYENMTNVLSILNWDKNIDCWHAILRQSLAILEVCGMIFTYGTKFSQFIGKCHDLSIQISATKTALVGQHPHHHYYSGNRFRKLFILLNCSSDKGLWDAISFIMVWAFFFNKALN